MQNLIPIDIPVIQEYVGTFNRVCDLIAKRQGLPAMAVSSLRNENKFIVQNGEDQLYVELMDLGALSNADMLRLAGDGAGRAQ